MFQLSRKTLKLVANWEETEQMGGTGSGDRTGQGGGVATGGGPHLDVEDPQVGDEVPARDAITGVAVEAEAGGVVDGVS